MKIIDSAPIPSPEAKAEPCIEIIFRVLQLFLTTTSRPRRREYTTPEEEDEPEPTTEQSSTETRPTEGDSSGESADGPSVDADTPNADSPSTTEGDPDNIPNEIVPKTEDTIRRLRRPKKKQNDWWFGGIKF